MTNVQILTIVIALATSFIAVLTGVLLNNTRLNDVKESLNHRLDDFSRHFDDRLDDYSHRLDDLKDVTAARFETCASARDFQELRVLMERNHSEMLLKFAEMDNRLSRIESERRIVS